MTAIRDERATARAARSTATWRVAMAEVELREIPGWLLVGSPARLDDPAQRDAAQRGIALRAELDELHAGLAALDAELDALDGPRRDDIFLFIEWSSWLAGVPDATTLLAELAPDPRRQFLAAEPAMTAATAQRIVDLVAANGGQVGDGQRFIDDAGLSDDDVWDLDHTARVRLDPLPDGHVVGVLLPMRLETRYVRPDAGGGTWKLRVHAHPDPVAMAGVATPNRREAELVARCWTDAGGDLDGDDGAAAFATLADAVGGGRAAYLLRTVPVVPRGDGFAAGRSYPPPGERRSRQRVALPRTLQLWGDWGAGLQMLGEMRPKLRAIAEQTDLGRAMSDLRPDRVPDLWWTSYGEAERVGLGVEVDLPGGPDLHVLVVTGLSTTDPRELFAAHAAHGDLGVVEPMAASNTVAGDAAADLGRRVDWLEVARSLGTGTAGGAAGPLTGRPRLNGVPDADLRRLSVVPHLVAALWPVLWQRWLKDVEQAERTYELGDWAARLLSPLGPWPAIRVGDVPYGIAPAVDLAAWKPGAADAEWEQVIAVVARLLVPSWAAAGSAGGTAAGASAEQLLEVIGRLPTSRQLGSRMFLPLEIVVLLRAAINGEDPQRVVEEWEAMAAPSLGIEPRPRRRYEPFGGVQPAVERWERSLGEILAGYLEMPAESLAYGDHDTADEPFLARLIRHTLLLTLAEAGRLGEGWATWRHPYELPLHEAERLARDTAFGTPVIELPPGAPERLAEHPPDPRAVNIARQFDDVRIAVRELIGADDELRPEGYLAPSVAAVLDTSSHRFDPWVTALGTRRLRRLSARGAPRRIGAYGWVDDLHPSTDPTPPTAGGLLHAPGHAQALTAAVLRDHAIHDTSDPRWRIELRSDLVRLAARLGNDVRSGVHISEAIGREIERRAGEPGAVIALRRAFPARPEWAGRRVCDGQLVLAANPATLPPEVGDLSDLRRVIDTYGDLLVADAVHDIVSGRAAAAQESMEAAAGFGAPPELRVLRTRREGASVRTTVLVAWPIRPVDASSPVALADPALATVLAGELGAPADWTWTAGGSTVSLADIGLGVADAVLVEPGRLERLATERLGAGPDGGTAPARRLALERLCSLLDGQTGLPEQAGDAAAAAAELRDRLAALRAAAAAVLAVDPVPPTEVLRWGLPDEQPAAALTARLDAIGPAVGDADVDAAGLAGRIRTLLEPIAGLPLVCTGTLPALTEAPALDRDWLEIVAAVRPALARLEAHQLVSPWPAAASDPAQLWSTPLPSEHHVVVYGPDPSGEAGPVGVATLDDWAETVPSTRHTTHAAFGFDAPRARAPQAVLLAVPPDEQVPLTAAALPAIVMATRQLARARMAQPDALGAWALAVPTSMVLATGPAGSELTEDR